MQPKRTRLFLAAALRAPSPGYRFEETLFAELKRRARASVTDLPWRPTFLPYLLSVAETPMGVLIEALKLRGSDEVKEYRGWLAKALESWTVHGHMEQAGREVTARDG